MKSRYLHNSVKKGFMIFFTVTLWHFMKFQSPPCFLSHNTTSNAETHPAPLSDGIIEQPQNPGVSPCVLYPSPYYLAND